MSETKSGQVRTFILFRLLLNEIRPPQGFDLGFSREEKPQGTWKRLAVGIVLRSGEVLAEQVTLICV